MIRYAGIDWESNSGASPKDLIRTEEALGLELPEEYREFLLATNGSRPVKAMYFFISEEEGETVLNEMNGAKPSFYPTLVEMHQDLPIFLEAGLLIVGSCAFNGKICLDLKRGIVIYIAWQASANEGDKPPYFIADSFNNFLSSLKYEDED